MVITTTRVTQMHDVVKTLQDGPESVKEILWSEGPWLGEELENAWENYYEVQGYSPSATCGNGQCRSKDLCVLSKSTGPDRCPNELTKTMTDEEFQTVKMWVNEILTEDKSRQRATMNGTISQLHKGGGTNKTSDQQPVVLLNSVYQLLNYVINERLKELSNQLTS